MSKEKKVFELKDEDLEKVSGGGNCGGTQDLSATCGFIGCEEVCKNCKFLSGCDCYGGLYEYYYECGHKNNMLKFLFLSPNKYFSITSQVRKVDSEVVQGPR